MLGPNIRAMGNEDSENAVNPPSAPGCGAAVSVPREISESHRDTLIVLLRLGKVSVVDELGLYLDPPFERETCNTVQERMLLELSLLPEPLLNFWSTDLEDKLQIVGVEQGEKVPAGYRRQGRRAFVNVMIGLTFPGTILEEAVHLLDHGLGDGDTAFSGGGGRNSKLREIGQRFNKLYDSQPDALGAYAQVNSREYLAAAIRLYVGGPNQRRLLAEVHAGLFEFVEQVWFNGETWKEALS